MPVRVFHINRFKVVLILRFRAVFLDTKDENFNTNMFEMQINFLYHFLQDKLMYCISKYFYMFNILLKVLLLLIQLSLITFYFIVIYMIFEIKN